MTSITAKNNPRIKELVKLCSSTRTRRESGRFVVEGARLVCDSFKSNTPIRSLFWTQQGIQRMGEAADAIAAAAGEVFLIADAVAAKIAQTESPQGVFALCEGTLLRNGLPDDLSNGCLLLCSLQDPGNVGTILRSADAFGLSAVLLAGDCPEPSSPKVLRASMGAAFRVWTARMASPHDAIAALKRRGVPVYAAALQADAVAVGQMPMKGAAVAIGNEGAGLSDEVVSLCDKSVVIPISPSCESLNAAMAATVFAWELARAGRNTI